jgi:hypothetical protein
LRAINKSGLAGGGAGYGPSPYLAHYTPLRTTVQPDQQFSPTNTASIDELPDFIGHDNCRRRRAPFLSFFSLFPLSAGGGKRGCIAFEAGAGPGEKKVVDSSERREHIRIEKPWSRGKAGKVAGRRRGASCRGLFGRRHLALAAF